MLKVNENFQEISASQKLHLVVKLLLASISTLLFEQHLHPNYFCQRVKPIWFQCERKCLYSDVKFLACWTYCKATSCIQRVCMNFSLWQKIRILFFVKQGSKHDLTAILYMSLLTDQDWMVMSYMEPPLSRRSHAIFCVFWVGKHFCRSSIIVIWNIFDPLHKELVFFCLFTSPWSQFLHLFLSTVTF